MCGIGGFIHLDPERPANPGVLENLQAALAHRGPDDAGMWHQGPAGLAHRRLSILDPTPAGHQPMQSADGRFVVSFNGELYNFRELRAELAALGAKFLTQCDTEVLLEAHRRWGDRAVQRFNGMFAYALYDTERRRLLLVRDRLGIKPLFYTRHNGTFAFASELNALRRAGFIPGELNPAALDAFFAYLYIPAPDTAFKDVFKLLPGEQLVVEDGVVSRERYWRLEYAVDPGWRLETAAEAWRALLEDAVRLQQVSDVPLGAFLSGGLDSSAVVGMLARQSARPIKTFSIGFDDAHADELRYARIAAARFATDHTECMLRPEMADLAARFSAHFGEPFADSSALPTWLVSQVARQSVTVALSGDGGDELFAGYSWAHRNLQVAQYRRVPYALRRLAQAGLDCLPESPRFNKLRRFHADSFLSPQESFRRRLTCLAPDVRAGLYTPEFQAAVNAGPLDRYAEHYARAAGLGEADRMLYVDTSMYLPDDILTKVDRMSMAHGLEVRVPLLDHRAVEFAATVPFALKCAAGVSKRLAKHALRGLLPPELLAQRKQGFAVPIQRWFREALCGHFREAVLGAQARCVSHLKRDSLEVLLTRHVSGREDLGHALWSVLIFEHWLRNLETDRPLRV